MAADKPTPASPVCYLPETENLYAGYLPVDEVHGMIRQWIGLAPRAEIATLLAALLPPDTTATPPRSAPASPLSAAQLRTEIRRSLPRIRDDDLHRALSQIADLA